tara:strand:- start:5062 stop:5304 length:243 start_codon:yes stop_codon:yes gene_type:complete
MTMTKQTISHKRYSARLIKTPTCTSLTEQFWFTKKHISAHHYDLTGLTMSIMLYQQLMLLKGGSNPVCAQVNGERNNLNE